MSVSGYEVIQLTNHYTIERRGNRNWKYRDCWVRTADGIVLAGIRTDLLGEQS